MTRDVGLQRAIDAAGGVSELARRLDISQPSVSGWSRVPNERVLAVEGATGISRAELRPDLYASDMPAAADPLEQARAEEYLLLAALLREPPKAEFLKRLARLPEGSGDLGRLHRALAEAAAGADARAAAVEHFALFVGVGRGELVPYASYYRTGFLHERPLAALRADLARLGLSRAETVREPEDHAATLFEAMAALILGDAGTGEDDGLAEQSRFFDLHLKPWIGRFLADLEAAPSARFYRAVARLGAAYVDVETRAFDLER